jgi:hypothetical protein
MEKFLYRFADAFSKLHKEVPCRIGANVKIRSVDPAGLFN